MYVCERCLYSQKSRKQKAENRKQKAKSKKQKAESRKQKVRGRKQKKTKKKKRIKKEGEKEKNANPKRKCRKSSAADVADRAGRLTWQGGGSAPQKNKNKTEIIKKVIKKRIRSRK